MEILDPPRTCLVLMPMYAGFEAIRGSVGRIIRDSGLAMCRLEQEIEDSAWHHWLIDSVHASALALVDLTDHNPFVMYELGYAHRHQLPVVYIVRASERHVPATVRGSVFVPYGDDCPRFETHLLSNLREVVLALQRPAGRRANESVRELYAAAMSAANAFGVDTRMDLALSNQAEFESRLVVAARRGGPALTALPKQARRLALLGLLFRDSHRVDVMQALQDWACSAESTCAGVVARREA